MMRSLRWRPTSLLVCFMLLWRLGAQDCDRVPTRPSVLLHQEHLYAVFDSLMALERDSSKSLNILHIGDSHIQGNFFTDKIRYSFYADFGLGSKGLAFPFRLAKTNSPAELRSSSYQRWQIMRNIEYAFTDKMGILGRAIINPSPYASFNLKLSPGCGQYQFDEVKVFYTPLSKGTSVILKDSNMNLLKKSFSAQEQGFVVDHFVSKSALNQIFLSYHAKQSKYGKCMLHGICLNNSKRGGINYHVAGVNGSQYRHWSASPILARQSTYLKPDLIIISLGTNDANDLLLTTADFTNYMHKLVMALKKANPEARFILTTPADSYFRKKFVNPNVARIREAILVYADKNNIACWDLYAIMGGAGSIKVWVNEGLAAQDLIHFSKSGYELQGQLFYQAFIRHYKNYVTNRLK
ncbi:MAG TPA: GDSL-type esterase/lipase family protein [Cytophagales bacterium]|nr:GDSL-type esterase/lipase family protein [Cytophagales bacterium]